jgi:quercetin dioxygenase-like cupin family protein
MQPFDMLFHGGDTDSGDAFVVETRAAAGWQLEQHTHDKAHLSYLVSGSAMLTVDGISTVLHGPKMITVAANKVHDVAALTDIVWLCIWAADPDIMQEATDSLRLVKVANA